MSGDSPEPEPSTFLDVVKNIADGGLLRLLASKPVQQAVGRLIFGAFDVQIAYFESISRNIRRETESKDKIYEKIVPSTFPLIAADEGLAKRGIERWTQQLINKQKIRENVAIRTLEILNEAGDIEPKQAPSEDFIRMFEDIVEKISSEELDDLMARILAGEIRKSGSVSRKTLQTVSILDQSIVQALVDLQPFMFDGFFWVVPARMRSKWYGLFELLSSVSIANSFGIRLINPDEHGQAILKMNKKGILITFKNQKFVPAHDGINLTPTGIELISVLPLPKDRKINEIADGLREDGWWENIEVIDI